jgi:hypothetical protein
MLDPTPDNHPARRPEGVSERGAVGGGGTAHAIRLPVVDWRVPEIGCCSPTGNRGAGATTAVVPMLMSPTLRTKAWTKGGGATTAVVGTATARFEETIPGSGVGATPEACSRPSRREVAWLISGGGATIEVGPGVGANREGVPADASGITGGTTFEAMISGRPGPFSLISGALMAAWARSGATRIEPRRADSAGFPDTGRTRGGLLRKDGNDPSGL